MSRENKIPSENRKIKYPIFTKRLIAESLFFSLQTFLFGLALFISLTRATGSCANSACASVGFFYAQAGPNMVSSHALLGYTFQTITAPNARGCFRKCSSDCRCVSFNYFTGEESDNCQLNDENRNLKPSDLREAPGSDYYDLVIDYNIKVRSKAP